MNSHYPTAAALVLSALFTVACGTSPERPSAPAPEETPTHGADGPLIVFLGDSLTAGYGLAVDQAFPAIVGARLGEEGTSVRVVNAGVSGDTSAGGLRRLDWVLGQGPDVLVVGLGANDALRGQSVEELEQNLRQIVRRTRGAGVAVLLLGMRVPTNYGTDYAESFAAVYPRVARDEGVALVPFLLEGVGGRAELNLADGLHPNARGQQIVAETLLPRVRRLLQAKSAAP